MKRKLSKEAWIYVTLEQQRSELQGPPRAQSFRCTAGPPQSPGLASAGGTCGHRGLTVCAAPHWFMRGHGHRGLWDPWGPQNRVPMGTADN